MHRLFIALRPPPQVRATLVQAMDGVRGARWQDDAQLHLTLRFVGEVERRTGEEIALLLDQIAAPPIAARIAGVGAFDRKGHIDTLWAGVAPAAPIAALHRKLDQALARIGIAKESRAFVPHITLARLSRGVGDASEIARWRVDQAALASEAFLFEHLYLYESRLGRAGAAYDAIGRWALTAR